MPHGKSVKVERPLTFTNGTNDLDGGLLGKYNWAVREVRRLILY